MEALDFIDKLEDLCRQYRDTDTDQQRLNLEGELIALATAQKRDKQRDRDLAISRRWEASRPKVSAEQFRTEMHGLLREYAEADTIREERRVIEAIYQIYTRRTEVLYPKKGIDARLMDKPGVTL
jgi:hypothetical protein